MNKRLTAKERDQRERAEISAKRKAIDDAADQQHITQGPPIGCGDSGCIVRKPSGQATNGGCRCDLWKLRSAVHWYRYEFDHRERLDAKRGSLVTAHAPK